MSHQALSADTEAVLLLCGRFGGERQERFQPLSARDYGELAKWLNGCSLRPADLMTDSGQELLKRVHEAKLERKRLEFLLERGTALALALERWSRSGLWVISRGDEEFPKRLKRHLKHAAPSLLYGAGEKSLLDTGGLAIVGSRDATEAALEFTRDVARQCACEGLGVVSGGARGVDSAAMRGAADAGGPTIGVLANDLLKSSVSRQNRIGLQEGHLVLVSPFYPEAGFNAGNAMGRNKYIYALADRALVIDSALSSGGTWQGAVEVLRERWVPLFVRTPGNGPGNEALVKKGGIAFTYTPGDGEGLLDFFERTAPNAAVAAEPVPTQQSLLSMAKAAIVDEAANDPASEAVAVAEAAESPAESPSVIDDSADIATSEGEKAAVAAASEASAAEAIDAAAEANDTSATAVGSGSPALPIAPASLGLYDYFLVKLTLAVSSGPLTEDEVTGRFGLERSQAKIWLKRAVESGCIEKRAKPVRYAQCLQASLLI